jgi:hypothetical protein
MLPTKCQHNKLLHNPIQKHKDYKQHTTSNMHSDNHTTTNNPQTFNIEHKCTPAAQPNNTWKVNNAACNINMKQNKQHAT